MIDVHPGDRSRITAGWLTGLCYVVVISYTCFMWGSLLHAKWGAIDDHEIMWMIGDHARLPLSQLGNTLAHTELAPDSTLARFRPSYFTLRAMEAVVWGKSAALWYAARVGIALLLAFTLVFFCLPVAGVWLTTAFAIFALSAPYWSDIFARAGPAETYVLLGVCLMALAWGRARRDALTLGPACVLAAGAMIASGSKENMLLLGIVPLWLLVTRRVRVTPAARAAMAGTLAFMAWIGLTVASRVGRTGTDIYSNDASVHGRAVVMLSLLQRPVILLWLAALIAAAVACWLTRDRAGRRAADAGDHEHLHLSCRRFLFAGVAMLAIYAAQVGFYTAAWPDGQNLQGRYLFPGVLAGHLMLLFAAALAIDLVRRGVPRGVWRKVAVCLTTAAVSLAFLSSARGHFLANREAAARTVLNTQRFEASLMRIETALRANPKTALVINVYTVWDIEPVVAVFRFVRAAGIDNPIGVLTHEMDPPRYVKGSLDQSLAIQLDEMSRGAYTTLATTAWTDIDPADCYSVGMHGPPLATCQGGFVIWPQ